MEERCGIIPREKGSFYSGCLSRGCDLCAKGAKMVLFITGLCGRGCFYCPVSEKKSGIDVIYANERPVSNIYEILAEAESMDALGTGITGGDPLRVPERICKYVRALKEHFGAGHHIHMYTMSIPTVSLLGELISAGLDEIRFHVPDIFWSRTALDASAFGRAIREARNAGLHCGIEVPALPGMEAALGELVEWAFGEGANFVNLNELELNHVNCEELLLRGHRTRNDISSAVTGSLETGTAVVEACGNGRNVHLCTVAFKDGVQLRNRIGRRALKTKKRYQELTEDNTLVRALILCPPTRENLDGLREDFEIPSELIEIDERNECITTAWYVAEEINPHIPFGIAIVEEYPTHDVLEVERYYLDKTEISGEWDS